MLFPANGSIVGTKTVVFQFIVQDASVISNCSLFINGTLNQTSNSITTNQTQTLSADLNDGNYTWTVNCTDSFGNKGNSTLNKFTERQTTNMTISAMTANSSFQQGEPIRITVSTKDLFGNPLLSYTRTAIIYLNTTITKDPWWNGSWPYRKMINITELNNTNLTNYQVNLAINSTALISSGKMNADCSDLRIADDYASEIPYWIESGCNTTSTQVWIKINLSASNSKIVYLYYGNAGAISNANASMVFDYYDSGSQLSNWTVVGTSGQTNAQGMPIPSYYAASASGNYMYRDISLTTNRILEFNVMSDGLGNFYFLTNSTGVGQHFRAETRAANNAGLASATSWTSWAAPTGCSNLATNTWYTVRLVISSTTAQAYINGLACGGAYTFVNSGGYIGLVGDALGVSYTTWWDNLRVRKYVTQEPSSVMSSSEERIIYWYANNTSILDGNISFIFDSSNQYYGNYSVVTVGNSQGFYAAKNYTTFYLGPDTTPPDVVLLTPTDFQRAGVGIYNFSYRPYDYNLNNCTFYININGTFQPLITNTIPTNNATNTFSNISLVLGLYKWNVLCFDILGNNASAPANFTLNLTGPDITLNSTSIWMQGANLVEGTNATILANISNIGLSPAISSFIVQFYAGDPSFNGIQIGSNITIQNLSIGESRTINTSYILKSGNNNIFVIIDSNNQLNESDETNNKANNTFIVELYQYYYGNMTANMVLGTSQDSTLLYISNLSIISGNLYIADSDSMFSFPNLQALGRNVNNVSVSNDFSNLDLNMNTSNYSDSITMVWTNGTNIPISTATFNISYRSVSNVPIVASTNNSNFMTGILWDMADDASHNLRYDTTDKEDIVFVTSFRPATQGKYGTYNYEIKIPATLRSYKGFTNTVSIYYEIN